MDEVKAAIQELKAYKSQHALEALRVSSGDAFQYGKACGVQLGLQKAIDLISVLLEDSDKFDDPKKGKRGNRYGSITR